MPREVFEGLFKFTFVRHPVEWQVSMFKHIMRHEHLPEFRDRFAPVYRHRSFEDYVRWRIDDGPVPQMTQMVDLDGSFLVDFVGRIEDLACSFAVVCRKLGIVANLDEINRSPAEQPIEVSHNVRTMIIEAYDSDMRAFGYETRSPLKDWEFDKEARYPAVGDVLQKVNCEKFDPWQVYCL